jgi:mycoredoxin-dependent peroxiredoxin
MTLLSPGSIAPDFTLKDQHGKEWRLSDAVMKGDVVLSFVPFAFTGTCSVEMGCISKDKAKWSSKGATFVGISCDSPYANKAWAEKEGYSHAILSDLHRTACKAYGLYWSDLNVANRGTVVIGQSGDGKGKIKHIDARPPGQAMDWEMVVGMV